MYLLALDIGTTGCRSVIYTHDGIPVSLAYEEYNPSQRFHPKPGYEEMNPDVLWDIVVRTIRKSISNENIRSRDVQALGITGIMGAWMVMGKNHKWLYPCIWTGDSRAREPIAKIMKEFEGIKDKDVSPSRLRRSARLTWFRKTMPDLYSQTLNFLNPEDYIVYKLCGRIVTDYCSAHFIGPFDPFKKKWDSKCLEIAGIDEVLMPETKPSSAIAGEVGSDVSEKTSLARGTPIVLGGYDVICGALGVGAIEEGIASDVTGTVEQTAYTVPENFLRKLDKLPTAPLWGGCHVAEDKYYVTGGIGRSSGPILRWYRDTFADEEQRDAKKKNKDVYDILTEMASKAEPGSKKLLLLPDFMFSNHGEGVLIGLSFEHSKNEIIRAILEGASFRMKEYIDRSEELGLKTTELRALGGGAKSSLWLQIKADIFQKTVIAPVITEATSLGAAILAGIGIDVYKDAAEGVRRAYRVKEIHKPDERRSKVYERYYNIYRRLRPTLEGIFSDLASL
ncbi:MAG: xylulokinase [Thermoproteota archaeon]|nr:xylulokinase [Thermoproteota archaeon]